MLCPVLGELEVRDERHVRLRKKASIECSGYTLLTSQMH